MKNISINKYLDDLAGSLPAPGGGSASSLAACLGVSLLCMVSRFSVGKKFKDTETKVKKILKSLEKIRGNLKNLIYLDIDAYNLVVMAKGLDKERKIKAYEQSKNVSVLVCNNSYQAIKLARHLVKLSNFNLISDLEAAIYLLDSAFRSAKIFAETNNRAIKTLRRQTPRR